MELKYFSHKAIKAFKIWLLKKMYVRENTNK